jgi:hypothetical protein
MATDWSIAPAAATMRVAAGRGKMTFTATNRGPSSDVGVVDVRTGPGVPRAWFTIETPQKSIENGESATFVVRLAMPSRAKSGSYWFEAIVYSAHTAPEETARTSGRVAFSAHKRSILWLVIAIAALWAIAGAAVWYVLNIP